MAPRAIRTAKASAAASLLLITMAVGGCKARPPSESAVSAYVNTDTLQRAAQIVKESAASGLIPDANVRDGCFARALVIAMELAAERIPSSQLYVFGELKSPGGSPWRYHVAPLLIRADNGQAFVIDAGLAPGQVMPAKLWRDRFLPQWKSLVAVPGSTYVMRLVREHSGAWEKAMGTGRNSPAPNPAGPGGDALPYQVISSWEELAPFRMADVVDAFQYLGKFTYSTDAFESSESLGESQGESLDESMARFTGHVEALGRTLAGLGKLDVWDETAWATAKDQVERYRNDWLAEKTRFQARRQARADLERRLLAAEERRREEAARQQRILGWLRDRKSDVYLRPPTGSRVTCDFGGRPHDVDQLYLDFSGYRVKVQFQSGFWGSWSYAAELNREDLLDLGAESCLAAGACEHWFERGRLADFLNDRATPINRAQSGSWRYRNCRETEAQSSAARR